VAVRSVHRGRPKPLFTGVLMAARRFTEAGGSQVPVGSHRGVVPRLRGSFTRTGRFTEA